MRLSNRLLGFLLPSAIPIMLYKISPNLLLVDAAYLMLLSIICVADYLKTPLFTRVEVNRKMNSKFSLGAENVVTLHVINRSRYRLRLRLKDDFPPIFQFDRVIHEAHVAPDESKSIIYRLTPLRRGVYYFADIHLQCWGIFGLIIRQRQVEAVAEVKVYPNLHAIQQYELLARRGLLGQLGLRNSRQFGEGTEIERLREYAPDDDFRRVDWKATARRQKPIVREFETERNQEIVIMLDVGRLMASPILTEPQGSEANGSLSAGPNSEQAMIKLDYAINATLMTSYVSTLKGDKVGLIAFSDTVHRYLEPKPGKKQFLTMLESTYALQAYSVEPDFEIAFKYLASKQRRRALIIFFTDILDKDAAEGLVRYVAQLARHHLIVCVTLTDSSIVALATQKPTDSKTVYQRAIAERLLQEKQSTLEILRRGGVITLDVPAHQLTMTVVNKYLELKAKSRI
jgi:uncharacterized protein (DUF58 family)